MSQKRFYFEQRTNILVGKNKEMLEEGTRLSSHDMEPDYA